MPSTYLELTNQVLRALNEVELTSSTFSTSRGLHSTAKDAVKRSIRKINAREFRWPFNAVETTQVLIIGQEAYNWPNDFKVSDWNSFQLQKDDNLLVGNKQLQFIKRNDYYHYLKDLDNNAGSDGRGSPDYVFEGHGKTWGVSPSPNETYSIKYRYWKQPSELVLYSDLTTIPSEYDYVILAGALSHMKLFKDDPTSTQLLQKEFLDGLSEMVQVFLSTDDRVSDTRVGF